MWCTLTMFADDTRMGRVTRRWLEGRPGMQGFLENRRSDMWRRWRCSVGKNARSCTWEGRAPGRSISWEQRGLGEQLCRKAPEPASRQLPDKEGSWPRASWAVSPGTQPVDQGKRSLCPLWLWSTLCITLNYIASSFSFLLNESCW